MLSGLEELRKLGTESERHHWCMKNEKRMKATLAVGLLMAAVSVWFLNWHIWLFMLPLTLVAVSYAAPIVRRKTELVRTREIGLWKIFLIAIVWSGITVILPAVDQLGFDQLKSSESWWLALERGIFILAITIPFDIRDLKNDAKKGVSTIPSTIGWFRSVMLAETLLLLSLFLAWMRIGSEPFFFGYIVAYLITMFGVSYAHPDRNDMYCSFWIEGTMFLLSLSVLITTS
jgi:4-hydroxybenzoate polyprenyltransferase